MRTNTSGNTGTSAGMGRGRALAIGLRVALLASLGLGMAGGLSGCGGRSLTAVRESGDKHMAAKRFDAAIEDYKEYIERAPGQNARVYDSLSRAYLATEQTGLARENALLAYALKVEDDAIFAQACEALFRDGKFEQLNRLLRARTIDRGRMRDFLLLGTYSERQGDLDEAQRAYLTAAQVDLDEVGADKASWQPHLALARLYMKVGDEPRMRERLQMAYYAGPNEPEVNRAVREAGEIPGPTFGRPPRAGEPGAMPASGSGPSTGGTGGSGGTGATGGMGGAGGSEGAGGAGGARDGGGEG